ncbi:MAG: hypothetical protein GF311_12040 [Candidatus Lokiarchaeota archaeon]|nr:hypothetical protein [Candidatus Lokiarchaeota archaeon]
MKRITKIALIVLVCLCGVLPTGMITPVAAQSADSRLGFEFSSDVVTKKFSLYKEYNNESFLYESKGISPLTFWEEKDCYWGDDGYYYVEIVKEYMLGTDHRYYNKTVSGYFQTDMVLDMYEVKVTYGDTYEMSFYALKNGTLFTEYYQDYMELSRASSYRHEYVYTTYLRKYEDESRQTLIDVEIINVEEPDDKTGFGYFEITRDDIWHYNQNASFAAPLIMINQVFMTPNGHKVAWGEFMWEMIAYNDMNNDSFYSVESDLYEDFEFGALIQPYILETKTYYKDYRRENLTLQSFPNDMSVLDAETLIEFSKPTVLNDVLSWGIHYNNFPFHINHTGFFILPEFSYSDSLKADFSFEFDFFLKANATQLDITTGFSPLEPSRDVFTSQMDGLSLCVPHYTYLLASMDIIQRFSDAMTRRNQVFRFESGMQTVCEIDMRGSKEPYVLYDHADNDREKVYNAVGAGVTRGISDPLEGAISQATGRRYFQMSTLPNLVFSVEDLVHDEPLLRKGSNSSRLVSLETENYPVWSGNSFYHDPSLKTNIAPRLPLLEIGIVIICGVIGISVVALIYRKLKK